MIHRIIKNTERLWRLSPANAHAHLVAAIKRYEPGTKERKELESFNREMTSEQLARETLQDRLQ